MTDTLKFDTYNIEAISGKFSGITSSGLITVTYSTSMTINASLGTHATIIASNTTAFAINAPTTPTVGQRMAISVSNTSGGVLGVATWNAVFKLQAWTQPATGFKRTIVFHYNGTFWVQQGAISGDIPN